jgi:glutaredoxin
MKQSISQTHVPHLALAILLALATPALYAQKIYRIIGPDGRVSFSDQPPVVSEKATVLTPGGRIVSGSGEENSLPLALRQTASRFPVTLYSGDGCEPCNSGRSLLLSRGIPFSERTVTTQQDSDALRQFSGQTLLPLLTIGGQQLKGFSNSEWGQFLDAAGYPKTSLLPSGYRNPPAAPLASQSNAAPTPDQSMQDTAPVAPLPPPTPADNPSGIRF